MEQLSLPFNEADVYADQAGKEDDGKTVAARKRHRKHDCIRYLPTVRIEEDMKSTMIKVAYCDDDVSVLNEIRGFLDRYRRDRNREIVHTAFRSPLDLLTEIERGARFILRLFL